MAQMRIPTSRLRKNMIVKSDVYTRSGVIIVPAGTEVTKDVVSLLTRHFIDDVIVEYGTGEQEEKERLRGGHRLYRAHRLHCCSPGAALQQRCGTFLGDDPGWYLPCDRRSAFADRGTWRQEKKEEKSKKISKKISKKESPFP